MKKRKIVFPYRVYRNKLYPIITVFINGPKGVVETEAYIDSGASTSIFLPAVAEAVGIDYKKGKVIHSIIGNGRLIRVYLHKINLTIGSVSLKATMGFSPHLADINLIGQQDVFDRFKITFDRKKKRISFEGN